MKRLHWTLLALAPISLVTGTTAAQERTPDIAVSLGAGTEYDSNVGVEEIDATTNRDDWAATFDFEAKLDWNPVKRLSLKTGYDLSAKTWADNSPFDQQIHRAYVDGSWSFDWLKAGVSYNHAIALLDSDEFLTLQQTTLYADRLFNNRYYFRVAADYREKTFEALPERDATAEAISADMYVFFNKARSFVSFGATGEREDAEGDPFDYEALKVKAKISNKFDLVGLPSKISLGGRYEDRDYENITPSIEAVREDERGSVELTLDTEFTDTLSVVGKYEYNDNQSNLPAADYTENVASLGLKLDF